SRRRPAALDESARSRLDRRAADALDVAHELAHARAGARFLVGLAPDGPAGRPERHGRALAARERERDADVSHHELELERGVAEATIAAPCAARARAVSSVSQGSHDEVSTRSSPPSTPSIRAALPSATSRTYSPEGSIVTTKSAASATSRGVAATRTPSCAAASRSAFARSTSSTVNGWPAFARWPAIGVPITPSPMKPIRIAIRYLAMTGFRG